MYQQYFQFTRLPFTISPDPAFLYPAHQYQDALAHLTYGVQREGGFILLTGEVGTGKTTLCRTFIEQLDDAVRVAYVLNTKLDAQDVLASICQELGVKFDAGSHSPRYYIELLNTELLQAHSSGQKTLVIIEEAQNLAPEVLEVLRLLTNLETNTSKLLHILLVGQPELLDTLARKDLRQLNQRVISRCHLGALHYSQTVAYIKHRLSCAGQSESTLFSGYTAWLLHRYSGGIPRLINLLADRALLGAYSKGKAKVSADILRAAKAEISIKSESSQSVFTARYLIALVFFVLILLASGLSGTKRLLMSFNSDAPSGYSQQESQSFANSVGSEAAGISSSVNINQQKLALGQALEYKSAAHLMQGLWRLPLGGSVRALCDDLPKGLSCMRVFDAELADVAHFNRPAILILISSEGRAEQVVLTGYANETLVVSGLAGEARLTEEDFLSAWDGNLLLLWKKPAVFSGWVRPGAKAPEMVAWLNAKLSLLGRNDEELITGGRYSQALAERVMLLQEEHGLKADGILGEKTMMLINSLLESPPLLKSVSE